MKQNIIFAVSGMALGGIVGAILGLKYAQHKQALKDAEEPEYVHLEYFDKQLFTQKDAEEAKQLDKVFDDSFSEACANADVSNETYTRYSNAESEHPKDDDEEDRDGLVASKEAEEYRKAHAGKIEMMKLDDWDSDFPEEDYEAQELWYFPETDELTDEDGILLTPMEKYVGVIFDRVGFKINNDRAICIRNHVLEKRFKVWKESDITKEDFFNY